MNKQDYEVIVMDWPSRPSLKGPAVIKQSTGEIVCGPWVEGTHINVVSIYRNRGPYRESGMVPAALITTPDGGEHYFYLD